MISFVSHQTFTSLVGSRGVVSCPSPQENSQGVLASGTQRLERKKISYILVGTYGWLKN